MPTLLDRLTAAGHEVVGLGKIEDLFAGRGLTRAAHTTSDDHGMSLLDEELARTQRGLIFINLVDSDTMYGHRNDVAGYAANLERFDRRLAALLPRLGPRDLLVVTADHGNDPTTPSTDHSREHVPLLSPARRSEPGVDLGTRRDLRRSRPDDRRASSASRRSITARASCARSCDRLSRRVRRPFMPSIREQLEARELEFLAPEAAKSAASRGRLRAEPPDPIRPVFQRDRDRVIHSKAFRRLKHKTQVFFAPTGDHYRTRLTHTLEVSQIARSIAKVLRLHEELTEAIALGHDLGHPPFGHAGERVIDRLVPGGFSHYEQSLRIVDVLENGRQGLNLTFEVRDGIARHSKGKHGLPVGAPPEHRASTIEGQIARVADIVAYVNHDIDDAVRAGILDEARAAGRGRRPSSAGRRRNASTRWSPTS